MEFNVDRGCLTSRRRPDLTSPLYILEQMICTPMTHVGTKSHWDEAIPENRLQDNKTNTPGTNVLQMDDAGCHKASNTRNFNFY